MALTLVATITATIAQSKFSGIYGCIASPNEKVILAITKGGHILGLSNQSRGIREALDPAKSTINADGKIKAAVGDGTTITATVSSDFKLKGTGKSSGGDTFRITGSRTLN